jgi:hypothetical protein
MIQAHTLTPYLFNAHFNIILSPMSKKYLPFRFLHQDASLDYLFLACYMPAHLTLLDLIILIILGEE